MREEHISATLVVGSKNTQGNFIPRMQDGTEREREREKNESARGTALRL